MIHLLSGTVALMDEDYLVLDVQGVGYEVFAPSRLLAKLAVGEVTRLFIYTHVREDHIHLYGFADAAERALFLTLTSVSGVGARMATALLSALSADEIARAVGSGDVATLTRANGVGKKLAERLVLELKGKLPTFPGAAMAAPVAKGAHADVLSALQNMGFKGQ